VTPSASEVAALELCSAVAERRMACNYAGPQQGRGLRRSVHITASFRRRPRRFAFPQRERLFRACDAVRISRLEGQASRSPTFRGRMNAQKHAVLRSSFEQVHQGSNAPGRRCIRVKPTMECPERGSQYVCHFRAIQAVLLHESADPGLLGHSICFARG